MNTKSLERRAARLQEKLQPIAPIGLPPTYWIDQAGDIHIALEGDERSKLPPNVYGFDPNQDGIEDEDSEMGEDEEDEDEEPGAPRPTTH